MHKLVEYEMFHYLMDSIACHLNEKIQKRETYTENEWRKLELVHDACVQFINETLGGTDA